MRALLLRIVGALGAGVGMLTASSGADAVDLHAFESARASAQAASARGDFARARAEWSALLQEAPEHPGMQVHLAESLTGLGRSSEAERVFADITAEGFGAVVMGSSAFAKLEGRPGYASLRTRAAAQMAAIAPASRAFSIQEQNFIAEGLAFDSGTGRFFAGSTYLRKILVREADGRITEFARTADHGLLQVLGMKADPVRHRLLVLTGTDDARIVGFKPADLGRSGVFSYDLVTGHFLQATWLSSPGTHLFNDLTLAPDGVAYITDSDEGRIYRLSADGRRLTPVTAAGAFLYPNGIDIEPAAGRLYVADFRGVFTVDLRDGAVHRMPHAKAVSAVALDGLYLHGDDLIGVQNLEGFERVTAFPLSKGHRRIEAAVPLVRADPRLSIATEGVIVADQLYFVADSHQDAVDEKGLIAAPERTAPTTILALRLPVARQSR